MLFNAVQCSLALILPDNRVLVGVDSHSAFLKQKMSLFNLIYFQFFNFIDIVKDFVRKLLGNCGKFVAEFELLGKLNFPDFYQYKSHFMGKPRILIIF